MDQLTPDTLYQMLGQFWYLDENNDKHVEEANKVYKAAHEAFPDDESFLLNYAITTYELERPGDASPLFEKFYDLSEKKDIKYLEYAAQTALQAENMKESKRLYLRMLGLVDAGNVESLEKPKDAWMQQIIGICQMQEDAKEEEKYIRLALDYFPMEKRYWKLLANSCLINEEYSPGTAALEIATRIALPDQKSDWTSLIDLYNFVGLPLRSAESLQTGFDLLTEDSTEEKRQRLQKERQLAVADAYVRGARVDKAVAYLDSAIAENPSHSYDLKMKKATILYEARRNEEAMAALDECIDANARGYDAYYMKGWVAWDMKDWDTAEEAFESASSSKNDSIRLNSKTAIEMLADLDKAISE